MKTWLKWLLVGAASVAFGILALSNTVLASVSVTILTAILLVVAGVFQIIAGFTDQGIGNKVWNVLLGLLMLVLGISFWTNPLEGAVSLALLVTILIAAGGILRMVLAWQMRQTRYFWAMLVSGAVSILLAALIFADFQTLSVQILGIFLGIELCFNGFSLIVLAFFLRRHPEFLDRLKRR
ncbi:HdeD family acid-resistance protein [Mangrovicoccus algicola]|uniref:DUF308 domain-containing protein n=1 Tax=Mangrovicoccus algicola TaxID=2771008 RepID=A0A8J6Z757_9RHOB|nr:DUF308 domain-containing protein [Mangrovicoccus algicola]MBE3639174.1 DUF308 domain-containing protein [Mangrovicoccus algicola]